MFSLQRFFGKEKTFLGLLEEAAMESYSCALALRDFIAVPSDENALQRLHAARQNNKKCCEQINEMLVKTFVTALEREDIDALATALYKLPKPVIKFAERYNMARQYIDDVDFKEQAETVCQAGEIVVSIVKEIGKSNNLEFVRTLNSRIKQVETEADALEHRLLHKLFSERINALKAIMIKDLHSMLEKAVDRSRDVGNIVTHVVLKNS